jgi:hypothetical protein
MAISRSQTGKTVSLKPPRHQQHRVIRASSPMEKMKKKRKPLLPASKKNKVKYKLKKIKGTESLTASNLWKFIPNVK